MQGTTGPLLIGHDTHALSLPAWQPPWRCWSPTTSPFSSTRGQLHPDARGVPRDPREQGDAAAIDPPTASSSRRRTIRPATAASSTTRRTAAQPTQMPPDGSRTGQTICSRTASTVRKVGSEQTRDRSWASTSWATTSTTSRTCSTWPRSDQRACGSARTPWVGRVSTTGVHRRAPRPRPDRGQSRGRPDLALHDVGYRRQDPDGLFIAQCNGLIDQGPPRLDISTGNDADADRHGVVTPDAGLMNPNHYLAVAIGYLFAHRGGWPASCAIGKTLVSSSMIDRVAVSSAAS